MTVTPITASDQILDTMTESLMLLDNDGNIKSANRALKEMLGAREEQLNGVNFSSLVMEKESGKAFLEETRKNGSNLNYEFTYRSERNKHIPVLASASRVVDQLKTNLGFCGGRPRYYQAKRGRRRIKKIL